MSRLQRRRPTPRRFGKHGRVWDHFRRIIGEVRPRWIFVENVPGIIVRHFASRWQWNPERREWLRYRLPAGLWFVLGDLASLGYDTEWLCLPASAVGASHRRERWFCLAVADGPSGGRGELRQPSGRGGQPDGCGGALEHAGRSERWPHNDARGRDGAWQDSQGKAPGWIGERGNVLDDATGARFRRREPGEDTPRTV